MSDINWTKTGIYYYVVVAREEYKEEEVIYYQGDYSSKELEELATEHVRKNTIINLTGNRLMMLFITWSGN